MPRPTDPLWKQISDPFWMGAGREPKKETIQRFASFCVLWTVPSESILDFSARTGIPASKVSPKLSRLRTYLGIRPDSRKIDSHVLAFAFLERFAPDLVQGKIPPPANQRPANDLKRKGPRSRPTLSAAFGDYLASLRAKERLEHQRQNQRGDQC